MHTYAMQIEVHITQNLLASFDELYISSLVVFYSSWVAIMILFGEI